jgi:hypothetical protein
MEAKENHGNPPKNEIKTLRRKQKKLIRYKSDFLLQIRFVEFYLQEWSDQKVYERFYTLTVQGVLRVSQKNLICPKKDLAFSA